MPTDPSPVLEHICGLLPLKWLKFHMNNKNPTKLVKNILHFDLIMGKMELITSYIFFSVNYLFNVLFVIRFHLVLEYQ